MEKTKVWWSLSLLLGLLLTSNFWLVDYGYSEENTSGAEVKILSKNLLFNGGFEGVDENKQPKGWTITLDSKKPEDCLVETDNTIKHRGKSSLKLTVRKETENVLLTIKSLSFIPSSGKLYRITGWVKQEGFATDHEVGYNGISLRNFIDNWNWKFTTNTISNFDWKFVEKLVGPATNEKELSLTLGLQVYKGKPIVWFDDFQVQEYNPPPPPANAKKWVYLIRTHNGVGGNVVDDPDGTEKKSFKVTALDGAGGKIQGAIISDQPPGLYRSTYRLKIAETSKDYILCTIGTIIYSAQTWPVEGGTSVIRTSDFQEKNKYQDFPVDFILPARGIGPTLGYGFFDGGSAPDLWIDTVTTTQLLEFTDETMAEFY